jgi:diketogulonate reductase-like aldo/keto reductase
MDDGLLDSVSTVLSSFDKVTVEAISPMADFNKLDEEATERLYDRLYKSIAENKGLLTSNNTPANLYTRFLMEELIHIIRKTVKQSQIKQFSNLSSILSNSQSVDAQLDPDQPRTSRVPIHFAIQPPPSFQSEPVAGPSSNA